MQISLHAEAPDKPEFGAPCNGCGVCCAIETCPVGRLRFLRKSGPCPALEWDAGARRYWCGMVRRTAAYLPLPPALARLLSPLFARWIAAGRACDSQAVVE
jgi:hypothetical protein